MSQPDFPIQGSCRCGRIKLEISAAPTLTLLCHCTGCQKMFSSAYSLTAKIPADSFSIVEDKPVIGGLRGKAKHYFCPHCMSCVFSKLEGQDNTVNVRMTVFQGLKSFAPFVELYTSEKLPWVKTTAPHAYEKVPAREELDHLLKTYLDWPEKII